MKPLSPSAKVTHFLFLTLLLLPITDAAAPNSSQGRICINLIKMARMIGIAAYILFLQAISPWDDSDSGGVRSPEGSVVILGEKMSSWK